MSHEQVATAAVQQRTKVPLVGPTSEQEARTPCKGCRTSQLPFRFSMAFQPIVDLQNRRIDGYEALVRGQTGEGAQTVLGQVTPDSRYAFDQACRVKAIELAAQLGLTQRLSINFLPNAVYEPRACIQTTLNTAARTGFPLNQLTFEILENEAIAEQSHLAAIISEYRRHGFQVALDDFATGYSGLSRLAALRPDIIKIDRVLVENCDRDSVRLRILAGLVDMCADIGIKVIFEGAERIDEVRALRDVGARFVQGFYFARPQFEKLVGDDLFIWPD